MLTCSESNNPVSLKPARRMVCRVKPGNDGTKNRSRDALTRPSYAHHHDAIPKKIRPRQQKGGEAPKGALSYQSPLARQRDLLAEARPPSGASPRHSPPALTPMAQPQNRVSQHLELAGVLPAYILASVKRAPRRPVFLPVDRCPRAARERIAFIRRSRHSTLKSLKYF